MEAEPGVPKLVADFIQMVCNGEASQRLSSFLKQASMVKVKKVLESLLAVPHYLTPCLIGLSARSPRCPPRPKILQLADRFVSSGGWGLERIFWKWVREQWWSKFWPEPHSPLICRTLHDIFLTSRAEVFNTACGLVELRQNLQLK